MVDVAVADREPLNLAVNIGDSYAGSGRGGYAGGKSGLDGSTAGQDHSRVARGSQKRAGFHAKAVEAGSIARTWVPPPAGLKQKDLIGIPWMLAFALRADGWFLRQDIIWSKPNPMPESVTDRCTKAHEYLFLLSKSASYQYDAAAIAEPISAASIARLSQDVASQAGSDRVPGKTNGPMRAVGRSGNRERKPGSARGCPDGSGSNVCGSVPWEGSVRNKRSVWEVATQPFKEAHFATFPPALVEPCILAGSAAGDLVLDPFGGAGTTGLVAQRLGRSATLIELNPTYAKIAERRIRGGDIGLPLGPPGTVLAA